MLRYIIRRFFYMIIAFLAISLVTYFLMKSAPGSFLQFNQMVGGLNASATSMNISPQLLQSLISQYHLKDPWYVQYWFYVWHFVTLRLGYSFEYPTMPTLQLIKTHLPVSFTIAVLAVLVAVVVSIFIGIVSAVRENTWADRSTMFVAMVATSVPAYVVAVFLALLFGVWLKILPVIGFSGPKNYVLPVLALAIPNIGSLAKYMRNSLISSLHSEYITTTYAKGGGFKEVVFGHALRNSLLPLITMVGPMIAFTMMGSVIIENMYGIPGMGTIFGDAAGRMDYPMIMDTTLFFAIIIMGMNFLVDLVYGVLDPRIRKTGYAQGR